MRSLPDFFLAKKYTNHVLGSGGHLEAQHSTLMKPPNKVTIQNWIPRQPRVDERSAWASLSGPEQRLVGRLEQ
eukprot:8158741-Pyramimonas_sp.AAC.1